VSVVDKSKKVFKSREFVIICIILFIGTLMSFAQETFFTMSNMMTIAMGLCADGFVVIGCALILIAGEIDLSVGSVQCLASVLVGAFYSRGVNIWIAAILAILLCSCMGCITGGIISKLGGASSAFIITLGMQGAIRGLCYIITKGTSITVVGDGLASFKFLGGGYIGSILPTFFVLVMVAIAISHYLLRNTKFCAKTYFIGSNVNAAELAGIKVKKMRVFLYMISAMTAAIAGVLCTARFGVSSPILGQGADGRAITAAVIGGTSMSGGEGGILGAFFGLILVQLISNSLIQMNVSVYWQDFISNMLLITVIVVDALSRNSSRRKLSGYVSYMHDMFTNKKVSGAEKGKV